jgi:hypothetical protein
MDICKRNVSSTLRDQHNAEFLECAFFSAYACLTMSERAKPLTPTAVRLRFRERQILTFGLRRKPLKLFCEHCGKFIPSDMEWVCGYCNLRNVRTKLYSFLNKCEQCKRVPKSFHCPHCNATMFFDGPRDDRHPARNNVAPPCPPETEEQAKAKKLLERGERKAELEYEIVCAKLDNDLAALLKQREMYKSKTPDQALEEDFLKDDAQFMGVHKIASEKIKMYEKLYADDPELLEMATLSVKKWRSKYI